MQLVSGRTREVDAYFGFESMMGQKESWQVLGYMKLSTIAGLTDIFQTLERLHDGDTDFILLGSRLSSVGRLNFWGIFRHYTCSKATQY